MNIDKLKRRFNGSKEEEGEIYHQDLLVCDNTVIVFQRKLLNHEYQSSGFKD
jgi:hypothetical protein